MTFDSRPARPYQQKPSKSQAKARRSRRPRLTRADRLKLLQAPWSLHFDREGTEDVAVIADCEGSDLAFSRYFWRSTGNDPIPPTLAGIRLMAAAPELLQALLAVLAEFDGPIIGEGFQHPDVKAARRVIAQALGEGAKS